MMARGCSLVVAGSLLLAGCGSPHAAPPLAYPAKGKVLLPSGQPARGAVIVFSPKAGAGATAMGHLAADGTFSLVCLGDTQGALPASYKVSFQTDAQGKHSPAEIREAQGTIPKKYWDPDTTHLFAEVEAKDNVFEFRLK